MQAVVVNDVEDLNGADVFFVVGYPNFVYADLLSPMALQQSLADFLRSAQQAGASSRYASFASNAILGQNVAGYTSDTDSSFRATVADMAGAPEEDLFLYTRKNVTLARGERASYNVFSAEIGIKHFYEWDVPSAPADQRQPQVSSTENSIWHSLRLSNSSAFPWTSAPAFVLSGDRPISQDMLSYTPKGGETMLKLTVATDLRSSAQELETERQPRAARWNGYDYDVVTVEGSLKIKSYKSKTVSLIVRKNVTGEVLQVSAPGKAEKMGQAVRAENPNSKIQWEIPLKPGQETTLTYKYRVLVR